MSLTPRATRQRCPHNFLHARAEVVFVHLLDDRVGFLKAAETIDAGVQVVFDEVEVAVISCR